MNVLDRFRLDGRRALVTGGSRGLGLEIARALGEAGADVVTVGRDAARLSEAVDELAGSGSVESIVADLATVDGAVAMCDEALRRFDVIDILVNNVGGRLVNEPLEEMSLDTWQRIIDLNLNQAVACTQRIGGAMLPRGWGRVVNVSSISGSVAIKQMRGRSYETAKAALTMFTRAMAADWAPHGVTVNAIAPGPFLTDANRRWFAEKPQFQQDIEATLPMGRLGDPAEVGPLAVFLASEAASYITGASVVIDGGRTLW
jgi:NAD(P)-dependent dehydrogenase (short-subunit alcohol dehydrogenase family)